MKSSVITGISHSEQLPSGLLVEEREAVLERGLAPDVAVGEEDGPLGGHRHAEELWRRRRRRRRRRGGLEEKGRREGGGEEGRRRGGGGEEEEGGEEEGRREGEVGRRRKSRRKDIA